MGVTTSVFAEYLFSTAPNRWWLEQKSQFNMHILVERNSGTGKSTIACTVADDFAKENQLGASFFFSQSR
jgi:hypothetical protein